MHWQFDLLRVATFLVTFVCGTAIAYSFMLLLTSISVWMVRNQSLMEMWWLFSSVARYPKEIFAGRWAEPLGAFFTYFVPILVVVNVPANAMVRVLDPPMVGLIMVAAVALALAQPAVLPVCAAVVSQREQLSFTPTIDRMPRKDFEGGVCARCTSPMLPSRVDTGGTLDPVRARGALTRSWPPSVKRGLPETSRLTVSVDES